MLPAGFLGDFSHYQPLPHRSFINIRPLQPIDNFRARMMFFLIGNVLKGPRQIPLATAREVPPNMSRATGGFGLL